MAKNKTIETQASVDEFLNAFVDHAQRKEDSYTLITLMQKWSGHKAKMWGPSIIGFGTYHYKYESGREGDMPLIGFSPRKNELSIYVYISTPEHDRLLKHLGKFKMGKVCIYAKKLSDIDLAVLEQMSKLSIEYLKKHNSGC